MRKQIFFFLLFMIVWPSFSKEQTPYFRVKDDSIYFIVFYQESDTSEEHFWEAYSDLEYHTRKASEYFRNGKFGFLEKKKDIIIWNDLKLTSPFGFIVYYNSFELMRVYEVMPDIAIIQEIGKRYSKLIIPTWLEGRWIGNVGFEHDNKELKVEYSFNKENSKFEVKYDNFKYPILLIIDSISTDYVRIKELHFFELKKIRDFGT